MFLWFPDRHGEHPLRDVQPPHRHLHQGRQREVSCCSLMVCSLTCMYVCVMMCSLTFCVTVCSLTLREYLFNAVETLPCVKKKADWAINWIGNKNANYGKLVHCNSTFSLCSWLIGSDIDQVLGINHRCSSRRACGGLRCCGGNLLLWFLRCHLLAEEERPDARTDLLQRAHQQRRGDAPTGS